MLRDMYHKPELKNVRSRLAVITGATSGIGRAYACYFATQGYDLIISGRRKEQIGQLAQELVNNYGIKVEAIIADLSKKEELTKMLKAIDTHDNTEVLINSAGYGLDCSFSSDHLDHQMEMLKVHVSAPLALIHRVLPVMIKNKNGIIINVSSLAAYMPTARNGMYSGTKSFLKSFTESLYLDVSGYGIKVQCLCPGFTESDFHRNNYHLKENIRAGFWMKPEHVVEYSIHCLNKGQVICVPGHVNRIIKNLATIVPRRLYYPVASKLEKSYNDHKQDPAYNF